MNLAPKISVIIPTHFRSVLLKRALLSVYKQSLLPHEIIIVDDGSDDLLQPDIINLIKKCPLPVQSVQQPHLGVSASRNHGASLATGEWFAFLDSDDEWHKDKIKLQSHTLELKPDTKLIHCNETWYKNNKHLNQKKYHKKNGGHIFKACLKRCMISPSASIISKEIFWGNGGFRTDFPVCEDYDLWLKICAHHEVEYLEQPLVIKHGGHDDQLSEKYIGMDFFRLTSITNVINSLSDYDDFLSAKKIALKKLRILLKGCIKNHNLKLLMATKHLGDLLIQNIQQMEKSNFDQQPTKRKNTTI